MPAWVALFAAVFLGERLTASRIGSIALCFVGVLLILRPGLADFRPEALLALGAALGLAFTVITTKKLTATQSTFAILFWMNLMQLPMNLAGSDPLFVLQLNGSMLLPLTGIAIAGLSTHYCLTNAFRCGDAIMVVPLDFVRVPAIALVGWSLYGEPLDALVFAGAGIIITGVLWNLNAEARTRDVALDSAETDLDPAGARDRSLVTPPARQLGAAPSYIARDPQPS